MLFFRFIAALALLLASGLSLHAQTPPAASTSDKAASEKPLNSRENYTKYEYRVPMRDGVKLFTVVYVPKDQSTTYPFLINRTPYSVSVGDGGDGSRNYGVDHYPPETRRLGPSDDFDRAGYIFVFQDIRGRYESEGKFIEMFPHNDHKQGTDVDTSSDMHDTVEFLLKNVPNHNGKVGIWGISYPGFLTSASIIDSHPAIKAASPQAPMTDIFMGDDTFHGGAFMLNATFNFYSSFKPQHNPTPEPKKWPPFDYGTEDAYEFYLKHGTISDLDKFFDKDVIWEWSDQARHTTYDDYWQARNLAPHLRNIHCAVLTVGGWYDAEDLQGPFTVFKSVGEQNPGIWNGLVIGPWVHGGWARYDGHRLGHVDFAANTSEYYNKNIVFPFFEQYLKDKPDAKLARATVFETGTNVWRRYPAWPPPGVQNKTLYFQSGGALAWNPPAANAPSDARDEYVSDPAKPVPFVGYTALAVPKEYMVADQRFAAKRTDVLTYQTEPLEEDLTVAGPVSPKLFVSTSGTDSDFDVKLIDVYPPDFTPKGEENAPVPKDVGVPGVEMSGFQQLVRGEPFRGKFRHGFERPEPFTPDKVETIDFTMPDIDHVFRRGHRLMVQVQSSWFPLTDRNPQTFVNIPDAKPADYQPATERVYRNAAQPSGLVLPILANP